MRLPWQRLLRADLSAHSATVEAMRPTVASQGAARSRAVDLDAAFVDLYLKTASVAFLIVEIAKDRDPDGQGCDDKKQRAATHFVCNLA
jgi:hypothetical protein